MVNYFRNLPRAQKLKVGGLVGLAGLVSACTVYNSWPWLGKSDDQRIEPQPRENVERKGAGQPASSRESAAAGAPVEATLIPFGCYGSPLSRKELNELLGPDNQPPMSKRSVKITQDTKVLRAPTKEEWKTGLPYEEWMEALHEVFKSRPSGEHLVVTGGARGALYVLAGYLSKGVGGATLVDSRSDGETSDIRIVFLSQRLLKEPGSHGGGRAPVHPGDKVCPGTSSKFALHEVSVNEPQASTSAPAVQQGREWPWSQHDETPVPEQGPKCHYVLVSARAGIQLDGKRQQAVKDAVAGAGWDLQSMCHISSSDDTSFPIYECVDGSEAVDGPEVIKAAWSTASPKLRCGGSLEEKACVRQIVGDLYEALKVALRDKEGKVVIGVAGPNVLAYAVGALLWSLQRSDTGFMLLERAVKDGSKRVVAYKTP